MDWTTEKNDLHRKLWLNFDPKLTFLGCTSLVIHCVYSKNFFVNQGHLPSYMVWLAKKKLAFD